MKWISACVSAALLCVAAAVADGQTPSGVSVAGATAPERTIVEELNDALKAGTFAPTADGTEFKLTRKVELAPNMSTTSKRLLELQIGVIKDKPAFVAFEVGQSDAPMDDRLKALTGKLRWQDPSIQSCAGPQVCVERDASGNCTKMACVSSVRGGGPPK